MEFFLFFTKITVVTDLTYGPHDISDVSRTMHFFSCSYFADQLASFIQYSTYLVFNNYIPTSPVS